VVVVAVFGAVVGALEGMGELGWEWRRVGRKGGEERIVQGRWMSVGVS
jgi:hypothetical protein